MHEFIYVLSNPSMPGLIKIGKTTTHPSQRMTELHSTGVPTPFVLEFSAHVKHSHASEKAAHAALSQYRVSGNREFFRVSVKMAIETILPVIGEYKLHDTRDSHGVEALQRELQYREMARQNEKLAQEQRKRDELALRQSEKSAQRRVLEAKLSDATRRQAALGVRPVKKELPGIATFLILCYVPIPLGWMAWLAALGSLFGKQTDFGTVCWVAIVLGFLCHQKDKAYTSEFIAKMPPWQETDNEIHELQRQVRSLT